MMIHSKKLRLWLYLVLLTVFIGACGVKKEENSKDKQIKENFSKTLSLYPTKNLEGFYDKEGFRDQGFEKGGKGTWVIHSKMTVETNRKNMGSRGLVLYVDHNAGTTKDEFTVGELWEGKKGYLRNKGEEYPVKMEHNEVIPTKPIADDRLRRETENFKFFVQYDDFEDISDYKDGDISYNPSVPSYSTKYQLNNDDYNVRQLRERYDILTKRAPKLLIKGDGDLKGSSIGHKNLEFTFIENKEEDIYFTNSINFRPTEQG